MIRQIFNTTSFVYTKYKKDIQYYFFYIRKAQKRDMMK